MAATGVPIRDSVGAALRFVRENIRAIAVIAGLGALAATLIAAFDLAAPQLSLVSGLANRLVEAFVYAAFLGCALLGAGAVRLRWVVDGLRVWAAMVVIGFFLFIFFFVLTIPVLIVLFAGPLAPYLPDLQGAGSDQQAVMNVLTRFAEENPLALLLTALFYCAVWFFLTSRLYFAAPATVDQQRILTFETWKWTRGATLGIIVARLMLLLPAGIFTGALGYLVARAAGLDPFSPAAASSNANPIAYLAYTLVAAFITLALYSALEAGLSTALYRSLKQTAPPP
jgi:hypothetical protein